MRFWRKGRLGSWEPPAYLHFLLCCCFVKYVPESLGLQTLRVLGICDVCRSRDMNFISTDGRKAAYSSFNMWPVPIMASSTWHQYAMEDLTVFFRQRQMNPLPSSERGASGCVTLGWFGFHARAGVWANLRSHFHWCWHIRHPSETCLSNCNMLCRKIRLLMLQ